VSLTAQSLGLVAPCIPDVPGCRQTDGRPPPASTQTAGNLCSPPKCVRRELRPLWSWRSVPRSRGKHAAAVSASLPSRRVDLGVSSPRRRGPRRQARSAVGSSRVQLSGAMAITGPHFLADGVPGRSGVSATRRPIASGLRTLPPPAGDFRQQRAPCPTGIHPTRMLCRWQAVRLAGSLPTPGGRSIRLIDRAVERNISKQ
jgi:hypothetical protein